MAGKLMTVPEPTVVGRPRKDIEAVSMRLEQDAYELARQAAAIFGESIVVYSSRVIRERASADLLEDARKRIKAADHGSLSEGNQKTKK